MTTNTLICFEGSGRGRANVNDRKCLADFISIELCTIQCCFLAHQNRFHAWTFANCGYRLDTCNTRCNILVTNNIK